METRISLDPGDSVANIHGYNETVRKGQIFRRTRHNDELVTAKDPNDKGHVISYARDALPAEHEESKPYEIKNRL